MRFSLPGQTWDFPDVKDFAIFFLRFFVLKNENQNVNNGAQAKFSGVNFQVPSTKVYKRPASYRNGLLNILKKSHQRIVVGFNNFKVSSGLRLIHGLKKTGPRGFGYLQGTSRFDLFIFARLSTRENLNWKSSRSNCCTHPNKKVDHEKYVECQIDLLRNVAVPRDAFFNVFTEGEKSVWFMYKFSLHEASGRLAIENRPGSIDEVDDQ